MSGHPYIENGVEITTHSMLKAFGRCPKQAQYKYVERLKKRRMNERDKPLSRGIWLHHLLEAHYAGLDWKVVHRKLSEKFAELFDEERESLGDLPRECAQIMKSYLWHYGANKADPLHGWHVIATEATLECPWPDGRGIYRCRVDMIVEDEFGMWLVDHKSHKSLPDHTFRMLDSQSPLYLWCAWENGYKVRGFTWNYLRTKAPTTPHLAYAGTPRERLSTAQIDTDYPTYYLGVKALDRLDDPVAREKLSYLKSLRWEYGKVQTSPFFRRDTLEKDDAMVARVVAMAMRTRDRLTDYDWGTPKNNSVELVTDRSCKWCSFVDLCQTELFGGNAHIIRRQLYRVGDPLDYYRDDKDEDGSTGI